MKIFQKYTLIIFDFSLSRRLAPEVLNHPNLDWPVKKQDRVLGKLQAFADRMKTRFESDNCGFYDSNLKHGGPDPNPDVKPNGKPRKPVDDRKRRDADTCEPWEAPKDYWWIKKDSAFMWLYSYCNTDNDYSCGAANDAEIEKREEFLMESTDDLCIDGEACEWFDMTTCTFREIENYKEDLSNTEDEEKIVQGGFQNLKSAKALDFSTFLSQKEFFSKLNKLYRLALTLTLSGQNF